MNVVQWLKSLGFEEYTEAFVKNKIDHEVLPELTDSDLKELGIIALGDRKKILAAITNFGTDGSSTDTEFSEIKPTDRTPTRRRPKESERRQITVMFCDMVGSTEISNQLDPEDLQDLMRQYQDAVAGSIARYDGYLAKFLGDGVLAYFGWPQAYEDQAERAIRAGLDAITAVSQIMVEAEKVPALASRVGIATGEVVIGDIVGEASTQAEAVIGETPNRAARLQTLAEPNQLIIGVVTKQLIGDLFEFDDLGVNSLKGIPDPVPAWRVVKERIIESRFEAAHQGELPDFVGREHELGSLRERWSLAKSGEGQVVLVSGDAGIGKSRLVQELRELVSAGTHFRMRYQCSPHHINTSFHPIIKRLERVSGFLSEDTIDMKLDKLEALLKPSTNNIQAVVSAFAKLLSLPGDRYTTVELTAQQLRNRTIEIIIDQIFTLSLQRPVLFLVEDVHWIDPSTEELIGEIIPLIANKAVFMLITTRPNYEPPWANYSHLTTLNLSGLSRKQAVEIIKTAGGHGFSDAVIDRIMVRADGNPLYVEELTRTVLDASATASDEISEDLVPPTLQASLVARIDRLDDAKEIAQIGAILGREFSYELLAAVAEKTDTDINETLGQLVQSGMVFRRGLPPESIYTFKHSLLQDAAYATILISRRQRLHKIIVEILEDQSEVEQFENVELIAHHALQAEDWETAFFYLQKAGLKSLDRSANREAVAFLEKALACIVHLPDSREKIASSIDIHFNLRSSLQALGEHDRVFEHLTDAETLAIELKDQKRLGWASSYLSQYLWWMSRHKDAENSGQRALTIASKIGDLSLEAVSNFFVGQGFFNIGNYHRAIENFRKNIVLLHGERAYDRLGLTGLPSVLSLAWWTWSLLEQGEFAEAEEHAREAQAIAETAGQPYSMATAYLAMGEMHLFKRDVNSAVAKLQRAMELCETWDLNVIYPMAASDLGLCLALDGKLDEALSLMQDGDSKRQSVQIFESPTASTALGIGYLLASEMEMAKQFALAIKEKSIERGFRGCEARALYLLGKIYAHPSVSKVDLASDYYLGALSLADELKMRPLSADCRYSLGSINLNIDELLAAEFNSAAMELYNELGLKNRIDKAIV